MAGLKKWMLQVDPNPPVSLIPRKVGGRDGGYGMVCNAPVKKGEKLVAVPRRCWMTSVTARESAICKDVILKNDLESWQGMCLHLLSERRLRDQSFWADYVQLLPAQTDHPILWTPEQQQMLRGSPMLLKLTARLEQVHGDAEHLISVGANQLNGHEQFKEPLISVDSVKWAAATLLSRACNLEIPTSAALPSQASEGYEMDGEIIEVEANRILALVPWADSLNHSSVASDQSILQYDHIADSAVLFAHRDYDTGEEVYSSYGTWLTPSELLLDYGFVDASNKNFAIQVPAESIANPLTEVNAELLTKLHGALNGSPEMTLTEKAMDDTLLSYMRCALAPPDELAAAGWSSASDEWSLPMDTMAKLVEPSNFNTEAKVLETLMAWTDRQLAGYESTLSSDLEEVELEGTPWVSVQALRALISEKKTLLGLQRELRTHSQALKEGCPLDQLYKSD